jgi:hypothetical protein
MAAPDHQSPIQEQAPAEALVSASPAKRSTGFFQEDDGTASSLRMMCMVSLMSAIMFGLLTLYLPFSGIPDGGNGIYFTIVSLVGAFAPKAIRKAV